MKNVFLSTTLVVLSLSISTSVLAGPTGVADGAPPELQHWSKLIGNWETTEESFRQDGTGWDPSNGADWNFYWSFDGWGVRDDYTSPPMSEPVADESTRQRGTNLRIYSPTTKQWVMTWLTISSTVPASFTATSTEDEIVMLSDIANPQGFFGRITFFDMERDTFEWKLEWSKDKTSWSEVYRIHGVRKPK